MKHRSFLLLLVMAATMAAQAQPYEIRAVNKGGGVVGVEMRITAGAPPSTATYLTDLVFGLRWQASYNVDLENTLTTNYQIKKSGVRETKGAYHYQAFFADNTHFLFPANWALNTWVEILSVRNTMNGVGLGTFEVAEAGFDPTTEPNFGVDLSDYPPVVTESATLVPLPVNLISFEAAARQNSVQLEWVTDQEEQSKGFEIERADQSNPANFQRLGAVASKGPSGGTYTWTDQNVVGGIKYYYRLKQIDLNERYKYSDIRTATVGVQGNSAVRLWPNPVEKELQLTFEGNINADKLLIKITDARGRVVILKEYRLASGRKTTLNVAPLVQGQYFLSVESDQHFIGAKPFFKQ